MQTLISYGSIFLCNFKFCRVLKKLYFSDLRMKIFNWLHRRGTGQASSVSGPPHKAEENRFMVTSADTEALLVWRDGLLTIGTLGFHTDHHPPGFTMNPSFSFSGTNSVFDPKDSVGDEGYFNATFLIVEEMLAGEDDEDPLVFNVYDHHEIEEEMTEPIGTEEAADVMEIFCSVKSDRITLADLFKADPTDHVVKKKSPSKWGLIPNEREKDKQMGKKQKKNPKPFFPAKLVKKLIPSHDAQPTKKISHMMKKMMKRKIHPEFPGQKSASEIQANEGIALLQSEHVLVS